jgi:hypothetical protein
MVRTIRQTRSEVEAGACPNSGVARRVAVGNPQRPVRLVEEKYEPQIGNAPPLLNPNYRQPLAYQPPMMARLGMEVDF